MTKKERDLLVKDLCARLSYGVKVAYFNDSDHKWYNLESIDITDDEVYISTLDPYYTNKYVNLRYIKPYLRPLSSMIEEEYEEFIRISSWDGSIEDIKQGKFYCVGYIGFDWLYDTIDWLNKHHFDYRGLIEKGLAIDCTNLNIY